MSAASPADPSPRALGESLAALAAQVADLRGQIQAINDRLDRAGLRGGLNLAARFEDLAQTVADALDVAAPRGPAADVDTRAGTLRIRMRLVFASCQPAAADNARAVRPASSLGPAHRVARAR
jgi:hypothetical protein